MKINLLKSVGKRVQSNSYIDKVDRIGSSVHLYGLLRSNFKLNKDRVMSYIYYNPNPLKLSVGDCTIRAISKVSNQTWEQTYLDLCNQGFFMYDMPSSNRVWSELLKTYGFKKIQIPDMCPACYTIKEFCRDNPIGEFILGTGAHVVAVINGNYYDSWDSGNEIPIYYFERR